ncbi:MAG: YbhB/YbcL family Raf kinase inhibitor-like protein [Ignavibacteriae bacterium]|nr:YbhB/YbcL family Raf kinase inhibitor-like protein [Ignavibacteriota bacterium]
MSIQITSNAFSEGEMIPKVYTCEGKDISPPLSWNNLPGGTKSLALINDDPDAPVGTWIHWVIFNIPPTETGLKEAIPAEKILANGTRQGITDFRRVGYGGPCPPSGTHRYFFKLYALDKMLELEAGSTKAQLLTAMEGHILGQGQLIGKYKKSK